MKKTAALLAVLTISAGGLFFAPQVANAMVKPGSKVLQEEPAPQEQGSPGYNIQVEKNDDKQQPKVIVTPSQGTPTSK